MIGWLALSDIPDDDLSTKISFWFKDQGCVWQYGCMILNFGEISETDTVANDNRLMGLTVVHPPNASLSDGEASLSLKYLQQDVNDNKAYYWEAINHQFITSSEIGDWRHIVIVVHEDSSGNYTFAASDTGDDGWQPTSFKLYIDGQLASMSTNSSQSSGSVLAAGVQRLVFFKNNASNTSYNTHRGIVGPVQIWNRALDDTEIRSVFNGVFTPGTADVEISMRSDEYDFGTEIFGYPSSEVSVDDSLSTFCGGGAADFRFCGVPFESDYEDYYVNTITEWNIGRGFLFGKENRLQSGGEAAWLAQPSALYVNDAIGEQCLTTPPTDPRILDGTSTPGADNDLLDKGWRRITDFRYYPGDQDGFFESPADSANVALRVSGGGFSNSEAGISNVTFLSTGRRLQSDNFCQIVPDTMSFTLPTSDTCALMEARVTIGKNFDAAKDQLYMQQVGPYRQNWSDPAVNPDPCPQLSGGVNAGGLDESALVASVNGTTTTAVCRKNNAAPDGVFYHVFAYKDLPILPAGSYAIYDSQSGALKISATNNVEAEVWKQVFQLVRYRYRDGVMQDEEYDRYRDISFSLGNKLSLYPPDDPDTPHYYEFVPEEEAAWSDSRSDALSSSHCGLQGYLASITSQDEQDFLFARFAKPTGGVAAGWLGGTDRSTEGTWEWVDGPENGKWFAAERDSGEYSNDGLRLRIRHVRKDSNTLCGGSSHHSTATHVGRFSTSYDPFPDSTGNHPCAVLPGPECGSANDYMFVNFAAFRSGDSCVTTTTSGSTTKIWAEPNNTGSGGEDRLQITGHIDGMGMWNDLPDSFNSPDTTKYYIWGSYVEYGGCDSSANCPTGVDENVNLSVNVDDFDLFSYRQLCPRPPPTP